MNIYTVNSAGELCYTGSLFELCMRKTLRDSSLKVLSAEYQSVVGATATTRMKYSGEGKKILGLDEYVLRYTSQGQCSTVKVLVKSKTHYKELVRRLGEVMIQGGMQMQEEQLLPLLERTSLYNAHLKEVMAYQLASEDSSFGAFFPPVYGTYVDDPNQVYIVVEGYLEDAYLIRDYRDIAYWTPANIQDAVTDLAKYHSLRFDRYGDLVKQGWLGPVMTCETMVSMMPLWKALADSLKDFVGSLFTEADYDAHLHLLDALPEWWGRLGGMKKTLIYNDIQIRNLAMHSHQRPRLCMFDWECVTIHVPQRDLVELLSYIMSPDVDDNDIDHYLKAYYDTFNSVAAQAFNWTEYMQGCLYALHDYQIDRLATQLALHKVLTRVDIERVFRTSRQLLHLLQQQVASP
jgi:hypothetical protein